MDPEAAITAFIRVTNAILWTVFAVQVWQAHRPLLTLARLMVLPVVVVGMWMLVIGALVTAGLLPPFVARNIYTIYTAFAGIIALVLVASPTSEER